MNGGEAVVKALEELNVKHVFGIPGVHNLPIYDALYDSKQIMHILTRHEQGAAYMADGYARVSNNTGVCLFAAGPGAMNAITAVSGSYLDSQPILVLAGGINSKNWGKGAIHELDQISMFKKITKLSARPRTPNEIYQLVRKAYKLTLSNRPRPVFLELPFDYLLSEVEVKESKDFESKIVVNDKVIDEVISLILNSKRIVIIAGGGVISSNSWKELRELANTINAAVTTTIMGKGAFDETDPLSLGLLFTEQAICCVENADLVIAVGCRFSERSTGVWKLKVSNLIHVDIDKDELNRNYNANLAIQADAKEFLSKLLAKVNQVKAKLNVDKEWYKEFVKESKIISKEANYSQLTAPQVINEILSVVSDNTILVVDTGYGFWHSILAYRAKEPRSYICSSANAAMGFALPAAIGAKIAEPSKDVVAIVGDGSMLMVGEELAVATELNMNLNVVIMNDKGYGSIRDYQRKSFGGRLIAVDYESPDFVSLAKAYHANGFIAEEKGEVKELLKESIEKGGVNVIDARISKEVGVIPSFLTGTYKKG
jgi:acetolactate synthase-1/2/3 large subunit